MDKLPAIETLVLKGIIQRITEVFEIPQKSVVFYTTSNRMQIAQKIRQMLTGADAKISWPQLFIAVSSLQVAVQGESTAYSPKQLSRNGVYVQVGDDLSQTLINVSMIPVDLSIEVTFITDDFFQAFSFATGWVWNAVRNGFNFTLNYGSLSLDVRAQADTQVATPPRDEGVDHPNVFEYVANIQFTGMAGGRGPDAIRVTPVLNKLAVTETLATPPVALVNTIDVKF